MIIHASNILATPFFLLIWAIDIFMFLCILRSLLGRIPGDTAKRACTGLEGITDPIPRAAEGWLVSARRRPVPAWVPWAFTFLGAFVIRQLLAWIVLKLI